MTVIEKIDYLINKLNISEKQFAKTYRIRRNLILKWRNNQLAPKIENVSYLCDKFNFEVDDFLDSKSTLDSQSCPNNEHKIKVKQNSQNNSSINEDYPHEDNARYEERD